jgi:hypothetical protein
MSSSPGPKSWWTRQSTEPNGPLVRVWLTGTEVLVDLTFTVVRAGLSGTEVLERLTFTVGSCLAHRDRSPGGPDFHPGFEPDSPGPKSWWT